MPTVQVIRPVVGLGNFTDNAVKGLGNAVDTGLYVNTVNFPDPPIDHATYKATLDGFSAALITAADGGRKATAEKRKQRKILCQMLRQLGHYAEDNCKDDMTIFQSSGFQPISTTRTKQPAAVPHILTVTNGNTGQLIGRAKSGRNTRSLVVRYGVSIANAAPASWTTGSFTNGRFMVLNDLTPGTTYSIQVRALGSLGYSDWTDPVFRMCT